MNLTFQTETELTSDAFVDVLRRSTLAERRPLDEPETIKATLKHADLIVTARSGDLLVGVSRAITDFAYCTYLSDLAVDVEFQKQGIGKELIRRTHDSCDLSNWFACCLHLMDRCNLVVCDLPSPALLAATPLLAFATGNSLTGEHSFTADLVLMLGDRHTSRLNRSSRTSLPPKPNTTQLARSKADRQRRESFSCETYCGLSTVGS